MEAMMELFLLLHIWDLCGHQHLGLPLGRRQSLVEAMFPIGGTVAVGYGDGTFGFMDDCDCSLEEGAIY